MQKNYFHPSEVKFKNTPFLIDFSEKKEKEEDVKLNIKEIVENEGPALENLKAEVEQFKAKWEAEKNKMIEDAKEQANSILETARADAQNIVALSQEENSKKKAEFASELELKTKEAEEKAKKIIENANDSADSIKTNAYSEGFAKGKEEGYISGSEEMERVIDKLHSVIAKSLSMRKDILSDLENQVVDLVLKISRKVVKAISKSSEDVIISNTLEALDKLKVKSDVVIRANLSDINILNSKKDELIKRIEMLKDIEFVEDNSIEDGGCIVETDFGQVDARISSQLEEIERKVIESIPVKSRGSSYRFS